MLNDPNPSTEDICKESMMFSALKECNVNVASNLQRQIVFSVQRRLDGMCVPGKNMTLCLDLVIIDGNLVPYGKLAVKMSGHIFFN